MNIYLSGPMTGLPEYNFPAFMRAATDLRVQGHDVFNPAESFEGRVDLPLDDYIRADLAAIIALPPGGAVVVLDGWRSSRGAKAEVALAEWRGLAVWTYPDLKPIAETCVQEAQRLVYGDRGRDYGHPLDDYERTAAIWTALLGDKLRFGETISAEDAVRCMVAVKLSRDVHAEKRDNRVDMAGYAECLQRITDERLRRAGE